MYAFTIFFIVSNVMACQSTSRKRMSQEMDIDLPDGKSNPYENDQKKRKKMSKIMTKISGSVLSSPAECGKFIECVEGSLVFNCPSSDFSKNHKIYLSAVNNSMDCGGYRGGYSADDDDDDEPDEGPPANPGINIKFTCDCRGGYGGKKSEYCVHINSVIISLCKQYVDNAVDFGDRKSDHLVSKKRVDEMTDKLNGMLV